MKKGCKQCLKSTRIISILKKANLFSEINHRVAEYTKQNPDKKVIRLGIGDVTRPLGDAIIKGLHEGVDAMASAGDI